METMMDWCEMDGLPSAAGDSVIVTHATGCAQRFTVAAAVAAVRATGDGLCVPDVFGLVRLLADAGAAVSDLCALATENRLLCRTVAPPVGRSSKPTELLARLAVLHVPPAVARHGPCG